MDIFLWFCEIILCVGAKCVKKMLAMIIWVNFSAFILVVFAVKNKLLKPSVRNIAGSLASNQYGRVLIYPSRYLLKVFEGIAH